MIADRKNDHVNRALDQHDRGLVANDFDSVSFIHHALAGIEAGDVSLATSIAGLRFEVPFFINAMTGGSEKTGIVNRQLAIAARETGLAIAAGSMSAYFADRTCADTYRVLRRENPAGIVMANINAATSIDLARRAVDLLEASALQIHLNSVQEIVMPEGDRSFGSWPRRIEEIVAAIEVPVIVKEVGFGLSRKTIEWLRDVGVAAADVGGAGGTNFASIENGRRTSMDFSFMTDWGQSTAACLLDAADVGGIDLVGSGGVRSPLDVARALALGAATAGVAGRFLQTLAVSGLEALISMIRTWAEQLSQIMTVLGVTSPDSFRSCDLLITGELASYCRLRDLDPGAYTMRSAGVRASTASLPLAPRFGIK